MRKGSDCVVSNGERNNHDQASTQCLLLNNLDQPLNRYWSVCLPQCVYVFAFLDDDDIDDAFFLLGTEAADAEDIVEVTEFDESFLLMTARVGQRLVKTDCGDCFEVSLVGVPYWTGSRGLSRGFILTPWDVGDVGDVDELGVEPVVYDRFGAGAREEASIVARICRIVGILKIQRLQQDFVGSSWCWLAVGVLGYQAKVPLFPWMRGLFNDGQRGAASHGTVMMTATAPRGHE